MKMMKMRMNETEDTSKLERRRWADPILTQRRVIVIHPENSQGMHQDPGGLHRIFGLGPKE
jgi:hypothetical protein